MTNPNLAEIIIVLDRSGSMAAIAEDTVGGFNAFIEEQKNQPGECNVTLVQFDNEYTPVYTAVPIRDVPPLVFQPRGMTALLDAIGRTIVSTGERLAKMPERERPGKVVFVVSTDGFENHSVEYSPAHGGYERIKKMVEEQTNRWNWQFVFLGANQDAVTTGAQLGVAAGQSMTTTPTGAGTRAAYSTLGKKTTDYFVGAAAAVEFDDEDRWENDPANPKNQK